MITCTRKIHFCAGHRVYQHESKCAHPHGHQYCAEITATASDLDHLGRIIDFSVLKDSIGSWIDRNWDHGFLLWQDDPLESIWRSHEAFGGCKWYMMPTNPTAENIAKHLLHDICPMLLDGFDVTVIKVRIDETPNCYAEASLENISNQ